MVRPHQGGLHAGDIGTIYGWYENGGIEHVAAYLAAARPLRLRPEGTAAEDRRPSGTSSTPAARPRTPSWPTCSTLSAIPRRCTIGVIVAKATGEIVEWLIDRRNRRAIPHRLERLRLRLRAEPRGQGRSVEERGGAPEFIYAKADLTPEERVAAARKL